VYDRDPYLLKRLHHAPAVFPLDRIIHSIRAPTAPTPATTANAKVAAKAYISTLMGTGRFLNHSILSVRPQGLFSRHRIPPSLILL
jgi:hypothetical protein